MASKRWYFSFIIFVAVIAALPLLSQTRPIQAAAGTRLYLSPASQSVTTGSNMVIAITIDPSGTSINTVQSVLSYSAANFTLVSITPGAAFGSFPNTASSGSIQFSAASSSPVTTVQTVATVTLHGTGTGSSAISLAGVCPAGNYALTCSAAYDSNTSNNDLGSVSNGSYSVAAVPVVPVPPVTPTTPAAPAAPGTTHTTKTTPSSSGSTPSPAGASAAATTPAGTTAAPATGADSAAGPPQSTNTDFTIAIRVTDAASKPIKGAQVTSGHQTRTTDGAGTATLQKIPTGRQTITIKSGGKTTSRTITVGTLDPKTGAPQQAFTLTAARGHSVAPLVTLLLVALLGGGFVLLLSQGLLAQLLHLTGGSGPRGSGQALVTPDSVSYKQVITPGSQTTGTDNIPVVNIKDALANRPAPPEPGTTIAPHPTDETPDKPV